MGQDWNQRLKEAYKKSGVKPQRPVRLPAEGAMGVIGKGDHAVIELRADAVVLNMQENASAFEGWSLALRYWCGAETVSLRWQLPVPHEVIEVQKRQERHYQRFLYRVERFSALFDWFIVDTPERFARWRNPIEKFFLNVAGLRLDKAISETPLKTHPEYELECRLLKDPSFNRAFKMRDDACKDRQFPVGLFPDNRPTAPDAIFPGGKGAIDLVCVDGRHLWLFELKAKKNIPIGTIAELLFYVSVMRDAVMGKFAFSSVAREQSPASAMRANIAVANKITGVMLGHDLHPLISDAGLIKLLNDAVQQRWNSIENAPAVSFRADKIKADAPFSIVERPE